MPTPATYRRWMRDAGQAQAYVAVGKQGTIFVDFGQDHRAVCRILDARGVDYVALLNPGSVQPTTARICA